MTYQQVIWLDDLPVGPTVGAGASQKLHVPNPTPSVRRALLTARMNELEDENRLKTLYVDA